MGQSIYEKIVSRELGTSGKPANVLRACYSDKAWIESLDIVDELVGHGGCVNALR